MSNKTCDYTRPGVEHWWSSGNLDADDDRSRDGASILDPRSN
jgi:hypothetical protein